MPFPLMKTRLHVEQSLGHGAELEAGDSNSHYLYRVLRLREGDHVGLFNGEDGEWRAIMVSASPGRVLLRCLGQTRQQSDPPDLWLLFSPLKKSRTDFIVEKATEIGVSDIFPVRTELTNSRRVQTARLRAVAREATEQCGGLSVPTIHELAALKPALAGWPEGRGLIFCDETRLGCRDFPLPPSLPDRLAVLIGPEGGFTESERHHIRRMADVVPVGLGGRLLRADTAAAVVLGLVNIAGRAG